MIGGVHAIMAVSCSALPVSLKTAVVHLGASRGAEFLLSQPLSACDCS